MLLVLPKNTDTTGNCEDSCLSPSPPTAFTNAITHPAQLHSRALNTVHLSTSIVRRVNRQILSLKKSHTPQPLCLPACTCVHSHYFLPTWTYQWTIKRNEILYWLIYCVTIKQVGLHAFPPVNANQSMYHNPIFFLPKSVWEIYFSLKLSQI